MTQTKKKAPSRDTTQAAKNIKAQAYGDLPNWLWAWAFLKRNRNYIKAYDFFMSAPEPVRRAMSLETEVIPPETPVEWLDLSPQPKAATTFSEWQRECQRHINLKPPKKPNKRRGNAYEIRIRGLAQSSSRPPEADDAEAAVRSEFLPELDSNRMFGLTRWEDPRAPETDMRRNPFASPPIEIVYATKIVRQSEGRLKTKRRRGPYTWHFDDPSDVLVVLDASAPLEPQFETLEAQVRRHAQRLQELWSQSQAKHGNSGGRFAVLLKVLDLRDLGLSSSQMCHYLPPPRTGAAPDTNWVKGRLSRAKKYRDVDYRALAFKP